MLSFTDNDDAFPFAQVKNGAKKGKILFVTPESESGKNEIRINDDGYLIPVPNPATRDVIYICGASGSGKSTYAAQYIYNYNRLFPSNRIFIFSRLRIDPLLEEMGCITVPINPEIEKLDAIRDLENALCLFDDIDTIPDKKLREKVYAIAMDILETGRHKNIYIIQTSHLINGNDRKLCRTILNEAKQIVLFPRGGNAYGIRYLLKNYLGLDKKIIDEILHLKSRSVTIHKNYPQFYFCDKYAKMI